MQPSKPGSLGRNLGDLLGGLPQNIGSAASLSSTGFVRLAPDRITLPAGREPLDNSLPPSFLNSVREHGILQPILVRKTGADYELIAGARRLAAARTLALADIPVVVIQASDEQAALIANAENNDRTNPPPEPSPVIATPAPTPSTRWPVIGWAAALAVALLVGTIGGWLFSYRQNRTMPTTIITPPKAPEPVPAPVPRPQEVRPAISQDEFQKFTAEQITVEKVGTGLGIVLQSPIFAYRTTMDDTQQALLKELGAILAKHESDWTVQITGHTDSTPLRGSNVYRDNNDLGLARATEVARYLWRQAGVPTAMLKVATSGADNPPFPSDTPDNDRKNRTATLLITPSVPLH